MKKEEENKNVENLVDKSITPEQKADGLTTDIQGTQAPAGRPNHFSDLATLEARIKDYFEVYICIDEFGNVIRREEEMEREEKQKDGTIKVVTTKRVVTTLRYPPTLSSLALYLGIDRDTLINYGKSQEFFGTIKKAKDRIHSFNENTLYNKQSNTVGVIFNLKNNFGWRDRIENLNIEPPDSKSDIDETKEFLKTWLTPSQPVSAQGEDNEETKAPVSSEVAQEAVNTVTEVTEVVEPKRKGITLDEAEQGIK